MKRNGILIASALTLAAGTALAAMGPQRGLPQGWTTTSARGYGAQANTAGNGASAMCVECHTVNPSVSILDIEAKGSFTPTRANNQTHGSHFVMNATAANFLANQTHSGGGFQGGYNNTFRDAGEYFRRAAWTGPGLRSKFGVGATLTSVNEDDSANGFGRGTAEMICESCHNVIGNVATAGDNDLLLGSYDDNVNDGICLGCHTAGATEATGDTAGYTAFHGNDNLAAFAGTGTRKRHHVLTGDSLTDANYATANGSTMWAPSASNSVADNWCTTPYAPTPAGLQVLNLATGEAISFRNKCNVAGQGTRATGAAAGLGDVVDQGATTINCVNCHRPHNAQTAGGAFILRYGLTSGPDFTGNAGASGGSFAGLDNTSLVFGIRRQTDMNANYAATKVYGDYRPLCAGCHQGY